MSRGEMRKYRLWHRSASIFVINEFQEFCINKRSSKKDYCPGWLDLSFGGVLNVENPDIGAKREAEEDMGIKDIHKIKLPGSSKTLEPNFLFKHRFEDNESPCWIYIYYLPWHSDLYNQGIIIKPKQDEITSIHWLSPEEIQRRITQKSRITPQSVEAFQNFMEWWENKN